MIVLLLFIFCSKEKDKNKASERRSKMQSDCKTIQVQQLIVLEYEIKWNEEHTPIAMDQYSLCVSKYILLTNFVFAFRSGDMRILFVFILLVYLPFRSFTVL